MSSITGAAVTQAAVDLKANIASPTFTGTVVLPSTTSIGSVSATEIGYVDGVTSALQAQVDSKLTRSSAATYAQTYATATTTHTAPTAATLTDNTSGTADTTLAALAGTLYTTDVVGIRNNFADLAAMVNKLTADNLVQSQLINSLIDAQQSLGLAS